MERQCPDQFPEKASKWCTSLWGFEQPETRRKKLATRSSQKCSFYCRWSTGYTMAYVFRLLALIIARLWLWLRLKAETHKYSTCNVKMSTFRWTSCRLFISFLYAVFGCWEDTMSQCTTSSPLRLICPGVVSVSIANLWLQHAAGSQWDHNSWCAHLFWVW